MAKTILTIIVMGTLLLAVGIVTLLARNIYDAINAALVQIKDRIKNLIPTWIKGK
jgi:hypothetical protein